MAYTVEMTTEPGRRERKKAATRDALHAAALKLFLQRGFESVTVREIADAVDVSTTTLMKYFPTKEALVFDREDELEDELVRAVVGRRKGMTPLRALRLYAQKRFVQLSSKEARGFFNKLVLSTESLAAHWRGMWLRYEATLARTLAHEAGADVDDPAYLVLAHFALEAIVLAARAKDPAHTLEVAYDLLERATSPGKTSPRR
jgi:AcrR family transcriptional regulator